MLIYTIVNIGNARLYGLEKDLGLHGSQYQVAVSILFVPYCVCSSSSSSLFLFFSTRDGKKIC